MKVFEIFSSIDGEVNHVGQGIPSTFIRFAGCNLKCKWCDIPEAQDMNAGYDITPSDIASEVIKIGCPKVTITGGEPLLQSELMHLLFLLWLNSNQVSIETNGTIPLPAPRANDELAERFDIHLPTDFPYGYGIHWVVDYKLPGSGITIPVKANLYHQLATDDWIKFVIANRDDYEQAKDIVQQLYLSRCKARLAMSPVHETLSGALLADWIISDKLWFVTLNCQIHKFLKLK